MQGCETEYETSPVALLVLRVKLVCLSGFVLLQILISINEIIVHGIPGCYQRLAGWMKWVRQKLVAATVARPSERYENRVQQMKKHLRVQRFQVFARLAAFVVFCYHGNRVRILVRMGLFGDVDDFTATNEAFYISTPYYFIFSSGLLVVQSLRRITTRTLDLFAIICLSGVAVSAYLQPAPKFLARDIRDLRLARLMILMLTGNFRLSLGLNVPLSVFFTSLLLVRWTDGIEPDYGLRASIVGEVCLGLIMPILFVLILVSWDDELSRSSLSARLASQGEAAVRTLLSALCDAVVRIDDDCNITEPSPQLQGMLLHNSQNALKGTSFMNVVVEEDRLRFGTYIMNDSTAQETAVAPAMHVRLRDSSGNRLLVQVLHGCFFDVDEQRGHLIGICDLSGDRENMGPDSPEGTPPGGVIHVSPAALLPAIGEMTSGPPRRTSSSAGSSSSRSSAPSGSTAAGGSYQVDFDPSPPHLIKWASGAFVAKYGPVHMPDSVGKYILGPEDLLPRLARMAEDILGSNAKHGIFSLGELKVRKARGRVVELPATVFFPDPAVAAEDYTISLQFDPRLAGAKSRSARSGRSIVKRELKLKQKTSL